MNDIGGVEETPLYLSPHVHYCVTGEQLVLLDVRRDEYLGLSGAEARALAAHVRNWRISDNYGWHPAPSEERVRQLLQRFVAMNILTSVPQSTRTIPSVPTVVSALVREWPGTRPRVRMRDVVQLAFASMCAARHLRFGSLESTVEHIRRRKEIWARVHSQSVTKSAGYDRLSDWVAAFLYLRPLAFRSRNNCLFDSLALVESLARRHVFPTWVFGVRVNPFAAHCWVQEGTVVFNDSPEHVRRYSPVLTI